MNAKWMDLIVSKAALGFFLSDDLPKIGVQALEHGWDSPSLRILAGLYQSEAEEAKRMFTRALSELGITIPTKRNAALNLAKETAKNILAGMTEAYPGAKEIWNLTLSALDEDLHELDPFVYAASEWEDRPEDRPFFEKAIVSAAKDLVTDSGHNLS
ncbi:MAG: hypothetical protein DWQ01_07645 [Planctomycetota bacterium]|nr:MAG: hypothetical protein DWQ01_07645 [Planctomycetota bacterium]